MRIHSE